MENKFFNLSAVTKRINELLQPAINKQFWVKGEISTGRERGGAFYCDLIETGPDGQIIAKLACTIWQRDLEKIKTSFKSMDMELILTNGTVVGFLCSLQFHDRYGISLRVIDADPAFAMGEMELRKREIIERLKKEGLFEVNKKLEVPMLPQRIGLITSSDSAAYNDFIQTLKMSKFGFMIYLADSMMQGNQTEESVLRSLEKLCDLKIELVVIVRGGGSKTDLYYLDNEAIARKIARCNIPIWTGIGHEIDASVLDFAANRFFKTPTAVAEELVARYVQMRRQLDESVNTLNTVWTYRLKIDREELDRATTGIRQGSRKLLDVTGGNLRERANEIRLHVNERINAEQILMGTWKERLSARPILFLDKCAERLMSKGDALRSRVGFIMSSTKRALGGIKQRFDHERFIRRIQTECDGYVMMTHQMRSRIQSVLKVQEVQLRSLKGRIGPEKINQRIVTERRSLSEKMAILKASDPKNVLKRGFSLTYLQDGKLLRSVKEVSERDEIRTHITDGSFCSEVFSKEESSG